MSEQAQAGFQLMKKVVVELPNGEHKFFDTPADAMRFLQRPQQLAALTKLTEDEGLSVFILDNREQIEDALEGNKIKRVTKSERNQLEKALKALDPEDKKTHFLVEHADAVLNSFRWPTQKRVAKEDQAEAVKQALTEVLDNNAELAEWIQANAEEIKEAFQAGVVKREINPAAVAGLAAYRARMEAQKAEKAAREGGDVKKAAPPEDEPEGESEDEPEAEPEAEPEVVAPKPEVHKPAPAPKGGKKK